MDRIVVVGAPAGGVSALENLVAGLQPDFPSALVIVRHRPADDERPWQAVRSVQEALGRPHEAAPLH
jgi:chemotaxis response regulator CheB